MNESDPGAPAATEPVQPDRIPTEPAAPPPRRDRAATALNVTLGLALVVAVAGVAFGVGRATAPAPSLPDGGGFIGRGPFGSFDPGTNPGANPGGLGGVGLGVGDVTISGTVEAIDADSLTIRTASGQTLEVALDEATTYHAQSDAPAEDVVTGGTVLVRIDVTAGRAGGGTGGGAGDAIASDVTVVP